MNDFRTPEQKAKQRLQARMNRWDGRQYRRDIREVACDETEVLLRRGPGNGDFADGSGDDILVPLGCDAGDGRTPLNVTGQGPGRYHPE